MRRVEECGVVLAPLKFVSKSRGETLRGMNGCAKGSDTCGGGGHDVVIVMGGPEVT